MSTSTSENQFHKLKRLLRYNETISAYWLLFPFLVMTLVFKGWPTVWAPWMATQEYTLVGTEFIGSENFEALLTRDSFFQSLKVTAIITFIRLPIAIGIGLLAAISVNSVFVRRRAVWRTVFIAPIVVAPVIIAILARLFLEPQGVVDVISNTLFGSQVLWLSNPLPAQFSVALAGAYVDIAVCFIFFLAGLVGIDMISIGRRKSTVRIGSSSSATSLSHSFVRSLRWSWSSKRTVHLRCSLNRWCSPTVASPVARPVPWSCYCISRHSSN